MKLFPFTKFYIISFLTEEQIKIRLSPPKGKMGSWKFKKKNTDYIVVYHLLLHYADCGPHMWISLNGKQTKGTVLEIRQKHSPTGLKVYLFLSILIFMMIAFSLIGNHQQNYSSNPVFYGASTITRFPVFFLLFFLSSAYLNFLKPFLFETNKNKKFIMSLLEAEPYTPPKQSTDNQKSDIIQ
jgi:hypothetical protein